MVGASNYFNTHVQEIPQIIHEFHVVHKFCNVSVPGVVFRRVCEMHEKKENVLVLESMEATHPVTTGYLAYRAVASLLVAGTQKQSNLYHVKVGAIRLLP